MKSFAVTPSEAELQALERDLHFYPTVNQSPKVFDTSANRRLQYARVRDAIADLFASGDSKDQTILR